MINEETEPLNLKKLQAGDQEELTKMVQQYSDSLYRVALRMLENPAEAEDVLQETFIKALKSLDSFEGRSSISTWLYRIAVNESLMVIRKRKPVITSYSIHYTKLYDLAYSISLQSGMGQELVAYSSPGWMKPIGLG